MSSSAKDVFLEAAARPEAEREAFLASACGGDEALVERVRALLRAHGRAEQVFVSQVSVPAFQDELEAGVRVGPYRLIAEIGQGGFGTVWLAEESAPIVRKVALKVLKVGMDTREVVSRFEAERRALGLMHHPCIARVYGGGATEKGRPYFAMELVDGIPITDYGAERALGVRELLELFVRVCRGVHHAHQKGVIHRDIKPSNVLVTEVDGGEPLPKVIDFGIAKALDPEDDGRTLFTREGQVVGTPAYMSPEQVDGSRDVDTRSDVYALGVLLYELLSGVTPFDDDTLRDARLSEIQRIIREVDPPKPSTRIARRAERATTVRLREVRGDLDWIVMRCLEKDREKRYESADALAQDVERHLRGEVVLAGPPSVAYRLSKFARRHRAALASAGALFVMLVAGIAVSTSQALRARRAEAAEREKTLVARAELARAESIANFLEHMLLSLDPKVAEGRDPGLLRDVLDIAASHLDEIAEGPPEAEAAVRHILGGAYLSLTMFDEAERELSTALEIRERVLGPEHPETLESLQHWGGFLLQRERFEEAREPLERAYDGFCKAFGEDDPRAMSVLSNYAVLLRQLGDLEGSAELHRRLEEVRKRVLGEKAPETVLAMNNYAIALEKLGRLDEAVVRYERALEIDRETLGDRDPRTLAALGNLAGIYDKLGRFDDAVALQERALSVKRDVLPATHPSLLISLNNLAHLYQSAGKNERALELLDEAHANADRAFGRGSPSALHLARSHGELLLLMDRVDDALAILEEAAEIAREKQPEGEQARFVTESALGEALVRAGEAESALPLLEQALEHGEAALREGDVALGVMRVRLALALAALERDDEALEVVEEAARVLESRGSEAWKRRAAELAAELRERVGE